MTDFGGFRMPKGYNSQIIAFLILVSPRCFALPFTAFLLPSFLFPGYVMFREQSRSRAADTDQTSCPRGRTPTASPLAESRNILRYRVC
ncbi:hypothetical protein HOY80DRAFT_984143, partial [Tuber brumale]